MHRVYERIKQWVANMNLFAWTIVVLAVVLSYQIIFGCLKESGMQKVSVIPQGINGVDVGAGTISIRGAFIDEKWYRPEDLFGSGNWTLNGKEHVYYSTDAESIILRIPYAETLGLVFDVGPDKGQAEIHCGEYTHTYNCNVAETIPYGSLCEIPLSEIAPMRFTIYRIAAIGITALAGVVMLMLCAIYQEKKVEINRTITTNYQMWQKKLEVVFLIFLLPCVAYVLAKNSVSSTPLVKDFYGYDAAWYWYAGNAWRHGYIPYIDTNLNKGPLVFFIYMIGSALGEQWGMYLLQCLAMWASLIGAYMTGKLLVDRKVGTLSAAGVILAYLIVVDEGALLEDFNLPFLMFSIYFIMKYMLRAQEQPHHPPLAAAFYGLTFGVTLYSRVTDSIFVDIFVFCICVYLIIKKEYTNLLQNALAFLAGLAVVVLPFLVYFAAHGALRELLEMYISNFRYAGGGGKWSMPEIIKIVFYLWPVWMSMLLSVEQRGLFRVSILAAGAVTIWWLYRSFLYRHYYVITLAFVPLVIGLTFRENENRTHTWRFLDRYSYTCRMMALGLSLLVLLTAKENWQGHVAWINALNRGEDADYAYMAASLELAEEIPENEKNSVMTYEIRPGFMLATHIQPCYKIVNEVEWWTSAGYAPERAEGYADALETRKPKWLVVQNDIGIDRIRSIVEQNYTLNRTQPVEGYDKYTLYLYKRN